MSTQRIKRSSTAPAQNGRQLSTAEWWAELRDDVQLEISGAEMRGLAETYQAAKASVDGVLGIMTLITTLGDRLGATLGGMSDAEVSAVYSLSRGAHDLVYDELMTRQGKRKRTPR